MSTYTVHQPPLRKSETSVDPGRFAFVRDGFHFWAFLLTPLWMLWRRLWLVLLIYVVVMIVLHGALWALGASSMVKFAVDFLVMLLIGFEASSLRRWTLNRRRWRNLGVVVGDNLEAAEQRFFTSWVEHENTADSVATFAAAVPPPSPPSSTMASSSDDVIGLFPEPRPQP
jgi:hypothetical protein